MKPISLQCLTSETIDSGACYGHFLLDSLPVGQGITIGNQLRRVLLGELEGVAISAVRIAGITHEFATLPGVREDVLELLLNLKGVILKRTAPLSPEELGRLQIHGPRVVTAESIQVSSNLEIVNPHHYLATLSDNTLLELEVKVAAGRGYQLAAPTLEEPQDNYLPLDTMFVPVQKVNFKVETLSEGDHPQSERLWLEIWTNGSLSPQEAVIAASQRIIAIFRGLLQPPPTKEPSPAPELTKRKNLEPYYNITIEELQLSTRAYNCLKKAGIHTIGDLLQYSPEKLLELKNFGRKSATEVFATLKQKLNISPKAYS